MPDKTKIHALGKILAVPIVLFLFITLPVIAASPLLSYLPNEAVVTIKSSASDADLQSLKRLVGASQMEALLLPNTYRLVISSPIDEKIGLISRHPAVLSVERNYLRYLLDTPNDPLYPITEDPVSLKILSGQWALQSHLDGGVMRHHVYAQSAWDLEKGQENVVVAVIDTGVRVVPKYDEQGRVRRYPHPDLGAYKRVAGTTWGYFRYVYDPPGRLLYGTSFTYAWDQRSDCAPSDEEDDAGWSDHGTHVAGIIAAKTNNDHGVASLCWNNVWVLPLRVFPDKGGGGAPSSAIVNAIMYCISYRDTHTVPGKTLRVNVINLSLGSQTPSLAERSAVAQAAKAGIVVCAAAGNNWDVGPYPPCYPGAYEEAICVSATNVKDLIAPWSQRGHAVDIAAPGDDILSTLWSRGAVDEDAIDDYWESGGGTGPPVPGSVPQQGQPSWWNGFDIWGNGYMEMSGTSMATPMVAAVSALLISRKVPGPDVKQILYETATPIGLGRPNEAYGWGMVNAYAALKKACVDAKIQSPSDGSLVRTQRPKFRIDLRNVDKTSIRVWIDPVDTDGDGIPDNDPVISGANSSINDCYYTVDEEAGKSYLLFSFDLSRGTHTARVRAETDEVFEIPPSEPLIADDKVQFRVEPGTLSSGWHLFSLPLSLGESITPGEILGTSGVLARWHYADSPYGQYALYSLDGTRADAEASFAPPSVLDIGGNLSEKLVHPDGRPYEATPPAGLGYWLYTSESIPFPELSGSALDSVPYVISLYRGWNMVGNPFAFPVDWSAVVVEYGGMRVPISEAVANKWLYNFVFRYDNVYRRYNWQSVSEAIMYPWEAQWILVRARGPKGWPEPDLKLIVPPSPFTGVLR